MHIFQIPAALVLAAAAIGLVADDARAETRLRVFSGGLNQRPDLMRKLYDQYQAKNPGVLIESETGGATSELQRQYLSTVFNAKDSSIDVYIAESTTPAQYAGAGWTEPLDAHVGPASVALKAYLPFYGASAVVDGKIAALPAFADAMFLYYRRDLLDKYQLAEPKTWDDLAAAAKTIQQGEKDPNLQGLSIQGAPIEGTVCTFLLPYWSQGKELSDARGRLTLDKPAAIKGMDMWLGLIDQGVIKKNAAEVKTQDTVNEFKNGQAIFAINWTFAWERFRSDKDSKVGDKVGVLPLPAMTGGKSVTCIGGSLWAVSAFSKNKAEAVRLVKFLASPESGKFLAIEGSLLPTALPVYSDAEVLKAAPWFKDAAAVVAAGQTRPKSRDYGQISDAIRSTTNAMLARTRKPAEGVDEIETRLRRVLR